MRLNQSCCCCCFNSSFWRKHFHPWNTAAVVIMQTQLDCFSCSGFRGLPACPPAWELCSSNSSSADFSPEGALRRCVLSQLVPGRCWVLARPHPWESCWTQISGPPLGGPWTRSLGWHLRICIFNKFTRYIDATDEATGTLGSRCSRW